MSDAGEQCKTLAQNLIDTLGHDRALHVARQFGWYGVVEVIARQDHSVPGVRESGHANA